MRKPINIAVRPGGDNYYDLIYAVCDDGTVWRKYMDAHKDYEWERISNIPQDGENKDD
jgi:hypothetical protein